MYPPISDPKIAGIAKTKPIPGPPPPPRPRLIAIIPLPRAAMTLPRLSLGTISAINAEQAGIVKAFAVDNIRKRKRTSIKPLECVKYRRGGIDSKKDIAIVFFLPKRSTATPAGIDIAILKAEDMSVMSPHSEAERFIT